MRKTILIASFLGTLFIGQFLNAQEEEASWAKKTLQNLSTDEKIGQLFMIAGYVDSQYAHREIQTSEIHQEMCHAITHYHIGGIAYVGPSDSVTQVNLTNGYQQLSRTPLLIAQDLEWGLAMRLRDGMAFPKNLTLGAIENNALIYEMGKEIGHQAKLIGVHMNLSPVLDVNLHSENLAIHTRSFGSSPQQVAEKGVAMIQGLQEAGILASAKHFPGLGDISIDPHLGLPSNLHSKKRLYEVELYPFIEAIQAKVSSIQTEHLIVPSLEPNPMLPASLSPKVVTDLLKKELHFTGLVLSGALRMKALTQRFSDEEIALNAFLAGSDMLLMPQDLPKAFHAIKKGLEEGTLSEKDLDAKVLKILEMKEKIQLHQQRLVAIPSFEQLHSSFAQSLKKRLYEKAVSIFRDDQHLLSTSLNKKNAAIYVQLGEANSSSSDFFDHLSRFLELDSFVFSSEGEQEEQKRSLLQHLPHAPFVILAVYPIDPRQISEIRLLDEQRQKEALSSFRVHGLSPSLIEWIEALHPFQSKIAVVYFGNPWGLSFLNQFSTLLMAYEADSDAQWAAAKLLLQALGIEDTKRAKKPYNPMRLFSIDPTDKNYPRDPSDPVIIKKQDSYP